MLQLAQLAQNESSASRKRFDDAPTDPQAGEAVNAGRTMHELKWDLEDSQSLGVHVRLLVASPERGWLRSLTLRLTQPLLGPVPVSRV